MFELLQPTEALLKTFTPRTEKHGEDEVSAASLGLRITGANTLLDILQPGLRDMLYKAVEGQEQLPGMPPNTPLLRAKGVESIKLTACFEGWTLKIDRGMDADAPFVIGSSKCDKYVVTPHEGGSVDIDFRLGSSDIDETEAGWLYGHQKQTITITLHAPEKPVEAIDGSTEAFERDHPDATDLFAAGGPEDEREDEREDESEGGQTDAGDEPKPRRRGRKPAEVE